MKRITLFTTVMAVAILAFVAGRLPVPAAAAPAAQSSGTNVVYTDDGKSCVRDVNTILPLPVSSAGGEYPMFLFNANAGNSSFVVRELRHPDVTQVAYIRPAAQLMVTLGGGVIRVWETSSGREKAVLRRQDPIQSFAVSSGRALLAGLDEGGRVWLWDLSRSAIPEPTALSMVVRDDVWGAWPPRLALSADGRILAVAESRVTAKSIQERGSSFSWEEVWAVLSIYDTVSGRRLRSLEGSLVSELIRTDGDYIPATMANGHAYPVTAMEFSPNGQALLTAAEDGTMRLWSVATGEHLRCYELVVGEAVMAFSPDGREIASTSLAGPGSNLALWNALTGQVVKRFAIPAAYVDLLQEPALFYPRPQLAFRPDGAAVALSFRREARVWTKQNGQLQALIRSPGDAVIAALAYSPDSRHLALAGAGPSGNDGVLIAVADHAVTRGAAVATSYVEAGLARGLEGNVRDMIQALREAERVDPFGQIRSAKIFALAASYRPPRLLAAIPGAARTLTLDHREWNGICWFGSLATRSDLFLAYCDKAVATAVSDLDRASSRDSRGVARMFAGDYNGAIEDFTYFARYYSSRDPRKVSQRQVWIDALRRGDAWVDFFQPHELWNN